MRRALHTRQPQCPRSAASFDVFCLLVLCRSVMLLCAALWSSLRACPHWVCSVACDQLCVALPCSLASLEVCASAVSSNSPSAALDFMAIHIAAVSTFSRAGVRYCAYQLAVLIHSTTHELAFGLVGDIACLESILVRSQKLSLCLSRNAKRSARHNEQHRSYVREE